MFSNFRLHARKVSEKKPAFATTAAETAVPVEAILLAASVVGQAFVLIQT